MAKSMKYLPHSSMYMEWFLDQEQYDEKYQIYCPLENWGEKKCQVCERKEERRIKKLNKKWLNL